MAFILRKPDRGGQSKNYNYPPAAAHSGIWEILHAVLQEERPMARHMTGFYRIRMLSQTVRRDPPYGCSLELSRLNEVVLGRDFQPIHVARG